MPNSNNYKKIISDRLKVAYFKLNGCRPWSRGYFTFKFKYIEKAINDKELMERFKDSRSLPEKYGYALDERVVEYPWVLSRISASEDGNFLDAGSALNIKEILESPVLKNKKITIANLNPETNCFWQNNISYVFADIRELPFKESCFNYITCISTLEHIGMDNSIYIEDQKYKEEKVFDFEKAILELKRVLKPGGKLLITVPFGKYQNFGRFQQFDTKLVDRVLEIFQSSEKYVSYYKYTKDGWNISDKILCKNSEYFDVYKKKRFDSDHAAGIRAVACIELIK